MLIWLNYSARLWIYKSRHRERWGIGHIMREVTHHWHSWCFAFRIFECAVSNPLRQELPVTRWINTTDLLSPPPPPRSFSCPADPPAPFLSPRFRYPIVWWPMSGTRPALMIAGKSGRCNDEGWRDTFSHIRYVFNFISHPSHPYHSIATRRKDSIDRPPSPNCWNANMNVVGCDGEGSQVTVSWKSDPSARLHTVWGGSWPLTSSCPYPLAGLGLGLMLCH